MKKGDLVKMVSRPSDGYGLVIGFINHELSTMLPWVKVYWGRFHRIDQGPMSYYQKVVK